MPVEVVAYMLSDQNINRRLQFQLILQCAPLLKGIKVACITNLERRHCRMLGGILKGTGITYRMLAVREERCLVILFREKETNASFYFQASYPSRLPVTLQATISKPALLQSTFRRG